MKRLMSLFLTVVYIQAGLAQPLVVSVEGYCYLEGQSMHSGAKVKFIKSSPSAVTDSAFTQSTGYFSISSLHEGVYDVEYSHSGYDTVRLEDRALVSNTTLPPVTLRVVSPARSRGRLDRTSPSMWLEIARSRLATPCGSCGGLLCSLTQPIRSLHTERFWQRELRTIS